jgi:hypothetical protein
MEQLIAEVAQLRQEVAELRGLRVQTQKKKDPCQGVTGKGTPCRNGALPGTEHCRMHSREPKPKKIQPEHTHGIGEEPLEPCPLCETHGDVMDPTLPDAGFEEVDDVTERLRELLSREN